MKINSFLSLLTLFILSVNTFASTTSFNIVENPFSHNVVSMADKNGWKQLDLKKKIAQLIMVRINGKFYNSESYYKRNLKKWSKRNMSIGHTRTTPAQESGMTM